ncbi:hypothetical protein SAMN04487911_102148 [Arenibacter nanhaiticus]|uniref:Uncharacterized protein n=1 Tax=Arenibacter nanhaiticus TaxID=558155 RepID=A0A1M6BCY5_9FLAO|nr:hypothetical protein [Arenibacter nanhaiticus]SHI46556.1 hypothetical protein SAMN04487911_102148 [Arenibacter nanhaiticus]
MIRNLTKFEKTAYGLLALLALIGLLLGLTNETIFDTKYAQEDGPVEWGTAILLLCISVLCLFRLKRFWNHKKALWKIGTFIFVILFFFAAGEEISWGQRILGIESGEFFMENNAQGETNLHNLVVGEKKINKIIFSQLLFAVMFLYLIVTPILYRKLNWVKNLADNFAVPVVKWHHTIAFLITTVLVALNPADRTWEVYELAFGIIFFMIFLRPLNQSVFKIKSPEQQ